MAFRRLIFQRVASAGFIDSGFEGVFSRKNSPSFLRNRKINPILQFLQEVTPASVCVIWSNESTGSSSWSLESVGAPSWSQETAGSSSWTQETVKPLC